MFTAIKNGQLIRRSFIIVDCKKSSAALLRALWNEGYIIGYKKVKVKNAAKLKVFLKYKQNKPVIRSIRLVSRPSKKVYHSINQIWKLGSIKSTVLFSTCKNFKSTLECKKLKIGGEPVILIN